MNCFQKLHKIIEAEEFQLSSQFFHSILEVCIKYKMREQFELFLRLMGEKDVKMNAVTLDL